VPPSNIIELTKEWTVDNIGMGEIIPHTTGQVVSPIARAGFED
jgi:hypothetical protein